MLTHIEILPASQNSGFLPALNASFAMFVVLVFFLFLSDVSLFCTSLHGISICLLTDQSQAQACSDVIETLPKKKW